MARKFSNNVQFLLDIDKLSPYYLVKIALSTGVILHTSTPMDVNVSGIGTFSANNTLKGLDAPRLTSIVDRSSYKLTYSDNDFAFRSLFESGIVGTEVTVYIGFYNSLDTELGGALPGMPLCNLEDITIAYKGFVDSHGHTTDTEGEVTAVIECSSPMADLDLVKAFFTSKDCMQQINFNDTSFDQVYEGSQAISLLWGKK